MGQDVAHGLAELTCVCMEMNGLSNSIACVHIVGLSPCKPFPAIDAEKADEETISFVNTTLTLFLSSSSRRPLWPAGIPGSCRFPFFDSCSPFSTTPQLIVGIRFSDPIDRFANGSGLVSSSARFLRNRSRGL
jgi:hypothetical protein